METTSPVTPALDALAKLKEEIKVRIGKEGGNLNGRLLAYISVIDATLKQIEPLGNMLKIVNQQAELAVHGFRALSQLKTGLPDENSTPATSKERTKSLEGKQVTPLTES